MVELFSKTSVPFGTRIGTIGDSKYKINHQAVVNSEITNLARGPLTWANFLKHRFNYAVMYDATAFTAVLNQRGFTGLNCNVSGDVTDGGIYQGVLTRIQQLIDKKPHIFFDNSGINDVAGTVASTIIANKQAILQRLLLEGKPIILSTIGNRPYSIWAVGSTARNRLHQVNEWLRRTASRYRGVYIFDEYKYMTDPSTGEPKTGWLDADGIHYAHAGGYYLGVEWNKLLDTIISPVGQIRHPGIDNVYDATNNPRGNICPPVSAGGAGTAGTGITGSVMTGWKLQRSSGSTITGVASVISDPDYGYLQQCVFTLNGSGGNEIFQFLPASNPAATFAAGSWVQAGGFVRVPSNASFLSAHDIQLRNNADTAFSGYAMKSYDITVPMPPNVAYEGQPITEPFQVPASPSTWLPYQLIRLDGTKSGTITLKFAPTWLMAIDAPVSVGGDADLWG